MLQCGARFTLQEQQLYLVHCSGLVPRQICVSFPFEEQRQGWVASYSRWTLVKGRELQ